MNAAVLCVLPVKAVCFEKETAHVRYVNAEDWSCELSTHLYKSTNAMKQPFSYVADSSLVASGATTLVQVRLAALTCCSVSTLQHDAGNPTARPRLTASSDDHVGMSYQPRTSKLPQQEWRRWNLSTSDRMAFD
jgi:hypothetical protein